VEKTRKDANRIDSIDPGKWMTTPFTETDEGFFQGRAIVTCVGVFSYRNADNSVTRELRLPEEVFHPDSLESMKGKPVTNNHPRNRVTADNAKKYQVGSIGTDPSSWVDQYAGSYAGSPNLRGSNYTDGFHVAATVTITNADAIADVKSGKTALSMGYTCDIEDAPEGSVWCGMAYDCVQRKIRYNHLAIVDKARAGDAAKIRMDGDDAIQIENEGAGPKTKQEEIPMKKIRIDGVEYEGEDGLVAAYQEQKKRADSVGSAVEKLEKDIKSLKKELSAMEADRDNNKDRADKAEKELQEAQTAANDPKRIDAAIEAKLAIHDAARKAGVEVKNDMLDGDIKKAVILSVFPEAKLDGKDETYMSARFDAAVELLKTRADGKTRAVAGDNFQTRRDSATAHQDMVDRLYRMSNGLDENEGMED